VAVAAPVGVEGHDRVGTGADHVDAAAEVRCHGHRLRAAEDVHVGDHFLMELEEVEAAGRDVALETASASSPRPVTQR
jgi:hypothetical protein